MENKEFECFEQQFSDLIGEFQTLSISTSQLREELRNEAARAEAAEAARDAAQRASADARSHAEAASAGTTQALHKLQAVQEELTAINMQIEFSDRQRAIAEEKYMNAVTEMAELERELQTLRPLQETISTLQRQFIEQKELIQKATENVQSEVSRLENEQRRLERCASAGTELRERARLAAAAHARDRRLASAQIQHLTRELQTAYAEISRQRILIAELECRCSKSTKTIVDPEIESLSDVKAALEAEKAGAERLEKALAASTADNALLAAQLNKIDNKELQGLSPEYTTSTNLCPIDLFLAD